MERIPCPSQSTAVWTGDKESAQSICTLILLLCKYFFCLHLKYMNTTTSQTQKMYIFENILNCPPTSRNQLRDVKRMKHQNQLRLHSLESFDKVSDTSLRRSNGIFRAADISRQTRTAFSTIFLYFGSILSNGPLL